MASILWFRRDLRVRDNPLLSEFISNEVLPIFIFDTDILSLLDKDDKRVSFIFRSVLKLKNELIGIGLDLAIFYGKPSDIFSAISKKVTIDEILASTDNDAYAKQRDADIASQYKLRRFSDSFLLSSSMGLKKDASPYRVFTPFYNSILPFVEPLSQNIYKPKKTNPANFNYNGILDADLTTKEIAIENIGFDSIDISHIPFLDNPLDLLPGYKDNFAKYKDHRNDISSKPYTTGIGIHLRFGTLGIREVIRELYEYKHQGIDTSEYIRQLIWREFWNMLLSHFPKSEFENFYPFDIKWENNESKFAHWCNGTTGVPIIDASMRELNATGYLHNRLRMVVGSFLTKNLHINWQWGERYFSKKLLDYEPSSNIGSWQWASSTGADGVPYFRIFNPYLQTKKFDKEGLYIKKWVKEYEQIPSNKLYDEVYLFKYGDHFYKAPIVSHKDSSEKWLELVNR
ncbi:MAG TPA: deoxyribodipyrimidine photo-lyase [Epsilonproteobacteria bacterium]|nr:deoxyribodipyrimidine photo-lyase [Campylobacterota bacterium]